MARVLIAGAGALGSVVGGFLRVNGHDVTLLGRPAHLSAVATRGLTIDGLWGTHHATGFQLCTDGVALGGTFDAIFIAVKSYDTHVIARTLAARLAPDSVVISLQNGLGNVETLAEAVGTHRVLGARVIFGAAMMAPGHVRVTVYADPVLIGVWDSSGSPGREDAGRAAAQARRWVACLGAAGIPSEHCDDIRAALWGKVLYNAALNPLGALLGVHYGALAENAHTRAIMDAVIDEAFAVAVAEGITLAWTTAAQYRAVFYDRLVPSTFDHRSSMLQDLERRRPTEIDAINGAVWKLGAVHGIVTPTNELLTRLVHARERVRENRAGELRNEGAGEQGGEGAGGAGERTVMIITVMQQTLDALQAHACETYPEECCGMIIERQGSEQVVRVTNIQNEMHAKDPEQFPRTAAIAYTMGREAFPILDAVERGQLVLRAFYHSHPDHDAYFSAEDKKQAMGGWDEPSYPQAAQIVISVRQRQVRATKAFAWDATARDYVEVPIEISGR